MLENIVLLFPFSFKIFLSLFLFFFPYLFWDSFLYVALFLQSFYPPSPCELDRIEHINCRLLPNTRRVKLNWKVIFVAHLTRHQQQHHSIRIFCVILIKTDSKLRIHERSDQLSIHPPIKGQEDVGNTRPIKE